MKKLTTRVVKRIIDDLKFEAWCSGRYGGKGFTVQAFDGRDKARAFRCISYNRLIRQINALKDILNLHNGSAK